MTQLHVATLNIRNLADRWTERLPLLLADASALQPDVFALQEVVFPAQQDRLIGAAGPATYACHRCPAQPPDYGNSLLIREPLAAESVDRLELGYGRAALRARVPIDGRSVLVGVTHLHHPPDAHAERDEQVAALVSWLDTDSSDGQIVMGDFNADPREPAYGRMLAAGFRSAHAEANGGEPKVTWPSGIVAAGMDTDGDPDCLDYIWIRGAVRTSSCRLVFDRPAVGDPTLYPSDHLGLSAVVGLG